MNTKQRSSLIRLALEIVLVLVLILIRAADRNTAQASPVQDISYHAPAENIAAADLLVDIDPNTQAALMAVEMAALTPPYYAIDLPIVTR